MELQCKEHNIKVLIDASKIEDKFRNKAIIDEKTGDQYWGGIEVEYWKILKPLLEKQGYTFDIYYKEITDYDKTAGEISAGKYDLGIASFSINKKRLNMKNLGFSKNVWFEKNSILYKPSSRNFIKTSWSVFQEVLIYPILTFIFLGTFFGTGLYFLEPYRINPGGHLYKDKSSKSKRQFRRTLLTTIVAFFGELGFIHENSGVTWRGIILILLVFIISFVVLQMTTAYTTAEVLDITKKDTITLNSLYQLQPLLCPKGNALGDVFKNLGAKISYKEVKSLNELVNYYLANSNKYGGIVMSFTESLRFKDLRRGLEVAKHNLGYNEQVFLFNKRTCCELFESNLNKAIMQTQNNQELYALCLRNFDNNVDAATLCLI